MAAGFRIEPEVSPPEAPNNRDDARAAADPPLEPPEFRDKFHGLWVPGVSPPKENSGRFVLPIMTAPASFKRRTMVASKDGTKSFNTADAAVVGMPRV